MSLVMLSVSHVLCWYMLVTLFAVMSCLVSVVMSLCTFGDTAGSDVTSSVSCNVSLYVLMTLCSDVMLSQL